MQMETTLIFLYKLTHGYVIALKNYQSRVASMLRVFTVLIQSSDKTELSLEPSGISLSSISVKFITLAVGNLGALVDWISTVPYTRASSDMSDSEGANVPNISSDPFLALAALVLDSMGKDSGGIG